MRCFVSVSMTIHFHTVILWGETTKNFILWNSLPWNRPLPTSDRKETMTIACIYQDIFILLLISLFKTTCYKSAYIARIKRPCCMLELWEKLKALLIFTYTKTISNLFICLHLKIIQLSMQWILYMRARRLQKFKFLVRRFIKTSTFPRMVAAGFGLRKKQ